MRREHRSRFSSSVGKPGLGDWSISEGGVETCSGTAGSSGFSSSMFPRGSYEAQSWLQACVAVNGCSTRVRDGLQGGVGRTCNVIGGLF